MDLLCVLFEQDQRGVFITGNYPWPLNEIAVVIGGNFDTAMVSLKELVAKGVIKCRESDGAYYSARMVRDEETRKARVESGKKGGNPVLLKEKDVLLKEIVKCEDKLKCDSNICTSPVLKDDEMQEKKERKASQPATEVQAVDFCAAVGAPPEFIIQIWNQLEGIGWVDATQRPVERFSNYVASRWAIEKDKRARQALKPAAFNGKPRSVPDHAAGF